MRAVIDQLAAAGFDVIEPCKGCPRGHREGVTSIDVAVTGTGTKTRVADDVNAVRVTSPVATAYVERSGRIWLLADGPTSGTAAVVYVAASSTSKITKDQDAAVAALTDALADWFGLDAAQGDSTGDLTQQTSTQSASDDSGGDASGGVGGVDGEPDLVSDGDAVPGS
jgi:hypothetical protein